MGTTHARRLAALEAGIHKDFTAALTALGREQAVQANALLQAGAIGEAATIVQQGLARVGRQWPIEAVEALLTAIAAALAKGQPHA